MNNKLLLDLLSSYPEIYEKGNRKLWDDEEISKNMLKAHLNKDNDYSSRNHKFIDESVNWICNKFFTENKTLLDLGCGPGIYAEKFNKKGFIVTGIDFSKRSIEYAKEEAKKNHSNIEYIYKDYLDIDYKNKYDVITLIYCDFGVLSLADRKKLLRKINEALKPNGVFIFDVWSLKKKEEFEEGIQAGYYKASFYSPNEHVLISRSKYYDSNNTFEQYIIIERDRLDYINVWNQFYTKESLLKEISDCGFKANKIELYNNVKGEKYSKDNDCICVCVSK